MLSGDPDRGHAESIAAAFGLGSPVRLEGPVGRGQLGLVWRLVSPRGRFAVKEALGTLDPAAVARDAAYQDRFRAGGVPMPRVLRTPTGSPVADCDATPVRVYSWVDVAVPLRRVNPLEVGAVIAAIHRVVIPSDGPLHPWYAEPVGPVRWPDAAAAATAAGAPFAADLAARVPELLAAETLVEPVEPVQICHLDLWADNVLRGPDGLVVLDWENAGPGDPTQELALVLFEFGLGDPTRIRALAGAYERAGGPGRVTQRRHFSVLITQNANILHFGVRAWLATDPTDAAERRRLAAWVQEGLDEPVTIAVVDDVLAALAGR